VLLIVSFDFYNFWTHGHYSWLVDVVVFLLIFIMLVNYLYADIDKSEMFCISIICTD